MVDRNTSTLPPSATALEHAIEAHMEGKYTGLPSYILTDLYNPNKIPAHLLPYLAEHLSADVWNPAWSERTKRNVIKKQIELHQIKGTLGGIETALEGLDMLCNIRQWYEYGGEPYRFKVDVLVQKGGMDVTARQELYMTIGQAKNLRSWLDGVRIFLSNSTQLQVGIAMLIGQKIRIYQTYPKLPNMEYTNPIIAIGMYLAKKIRIEMENE